MPIAFDWAPDVAAALDRLVAAGGPGVACFDADGTLWSGDVVVSFIEETLPRLPARETPGFDATLARVLGEINYETARLQHAVFAGLPASLAAAWSEESFARRIAPTAYDRVWHLVREFEAAGIEVWICSGSPDWLVQPGAARLGIPPGRVLASRPGIRDGVFEAEPVVVTAGPGKAEAVARHVGPRLHFAAGDSMSDFPMLEMADHRLVLAPPDPDGRLGGLADKARARGWWVQPIAAHLVGA
ncbi:MAG: HAD-IB family phosphatase [Candidatus Sericytochromatia bacterium]|nr:HAD-IB family phosphatase [Candidatus Tanganyikabacteria bacterium]